MFHLFIDTNTDQRKADIENIKINLNRKVSVRNQTRILPADTQANSDYQQLSYSMRTAHMEYRPARRTHGIPARPWHTLTYCDLTAPRVINS